MYIDKKMSGKDIAKELGYKTPNTIYNKLKKANIPRRGAKECQFSIELNKDELKDLYLNKNFSMAQIATIIGIGKETIRRFLIKFNIPIRNKTCNFGGWNKGKNLSIIHKKHLSEIRKSLYASGMQHWNTGNSWCAEVREKISHTLLKGREPCPSYYGSNWKLQRTACLQRDNYTCQQCGNIENIEVHHWEPYRFCYDNSLENLITFCELCHKEIHAEYKREGFIDDAEYEFYVDY